MAANRQADRDTTDRHEDGQRGTTTARDRQTDTKRQRDRKTDRHAGRHIHKANTEIDRQAGNQRGTKTDAGK